MTDILLFGTQGCHLCEEAEALLLQTGLSFEKLDIIENEKAQELYAVRIPVLLHKPSGLELNWPFDAQQIRLFLG